VPAAKPAEAKPAERPVAAASPVAKTEAKAAAAASPATKPAFDEKAIADFYRGKTIRVVVGTVPGGTYDLYPRMVAKYLPKYLPGSPTMVVENKPGAGSMLALNLVFNTEPKDGTVISGFNEYVILQQAIEADGVQFDTRKLHWLGSVLKNATACIARKDSGVSRVQDIIEGDKQLISASIAPGSNTHDVPNTMNAALGTRFKLVSGYDGGAKLALAVQSKETDGYCLTWASMLSGGTFRELIDGPNALARVIVIMGSKTPDHPLLKDVPAAETLAKSEEARLLLRAVHAPSDVSNPLAVAPEVPAERVAALRDALEKTWKDPEFLAEAQKIQMDVAPTRGEEASRVAQEILGLPSATLARLKAILKQ
jgi:tripartite-type tricarboxylate transporter receptor subunit TctC